MAATSRQGSSEPSLISSLHDALQDVHAHPPPHVPNPPGCTKRASVALIIRVRPTYESRNQVDNNAAAQLLTNAESSTKDTLKKFFSTPWVQAGDAEVLFIKRASAVGDRWSGHVACPGGRRDPEDEDDAAVAIREAREEVGLDLSDPRCVLVGQLPERVVTTSWGRQVLMVLCPFVFLYTSQEVPPVSLQPTEIGATHWVPLRALLSPSLRTVERVDVSDRLAKRAGNTVKSILRSLMGKMTFSAVQLIPSESVMCSAAPGFVPEHKETTSYLQNLKAALFPTSKPLHTAPQLLLWGLTLGVVSDLLEKLPPHNAVELWRYPTFTAPDLRLITWLLTYNLRKRNYEALRNGTALNQTAVDATTAAMAVDPEQDTSNDVGIGGLGIHKRGSTHAVGIMLEGYYEKVRLAVALFVALRLGVGAVGIAALVKLWRRR